MDLAELIAAQRFATPRFRAGYDTDEVDSFLGTVASAARAEDLGTLEQAAQNLPELRFTPVRSSSRYEMDEVDTFLDDVLGPRLVEHVAGIVAGMSPSEHAARRLSGHGLVPARTGDRYDREQIDHGLAQARSLLEGGERPDGRDDEAGRRRAGLEVLEAMRPETARGLRPGYPRAAVDSLLMGTTAILRGE